MMPILRTAAAFAMSLYASKLMPTSESPKGQDDESDEHRSNETGVPETETDPYETLVQELDNHRKEAREVYGTAVLITLLLFGILGVLHVPEPYGPNLFTPDSSLELVTWGITILVVMVVAVTFDRVRTLPPDLRSGPTDRAELARRIRHTDGVLYLNMASLTITAMLVALTLMKLLFFKADPLTAVIVLLILLLFAWCFCQFAISARLANTLLENIEAHRDRRLDSARHRLQGTRPISIGRRVLLGLVFGVIANIAWLTALNYVAPDGASFKLILQVFAVVLVTCLPLPMLYAGGVAMDAENGLKRLRIYGTNRKAKQRWLPRHGGAIGCSLIALAGPGLIIGSLFWAGWPDPRIWIMIGGLLLTWGLSVAPVVHGTRRIHRWAQLRYIQKRDNQPQNTGARAGSERQRAATAPHSESGAGERSHRPVISTVRA